MKLGHHIATAFYIIIIGMGLFISCPAAAETTTLIFNHPYSSMHPQHTQVFVPWANEVETRSQGDLKIQFNVDDKGMKPGEILTGLHLGATDIGWDICAYNPDTFVLNTVFELPFLMTASGSGSVAVWRSVNKSPALQKEFGPVKLLSIAIPPPAGIATATKPIRNLDDFQGILIPTPSRPVSLAVDLLGAKQSNLKGMGSSDFNKALDLKLIDGFFVPWEGIMFYQIAEKLKYYTPINITSGVFWVAINEKKYNALSASARKVLDELSGEYLVHKVAEAFEAGSAYAEQHCLQKGMQNVSISEADLAAIVEKVKKPVQKDWIDAMTAKGLPGQEVMNIVSQTLE